MMHAWWYLLLYDGVFSFYGTPTYVVIVALLKSTNGVVYQPTAALLGGWLLH